MQKDIEQSIDKLNFLSNKKEDIQKKIIVDQLDILYKNLIVSIPGNFFCSSLIFFSLYQFNRSNILLTWFGAVILITFFRSLIYYHYCYRHIYKDKLYLSLFIISSILASILWGIVDSVLMPPGAYLQQMVIIVIIAGVTAGSIQSLQSSLIACLSYLVISIFPLVIWLYLQAGSPYFILGLSMTAYLCFVISITFRGYNLLISKLELHYENIDLIEKLSVSNRQLQTSFKSLALSENRFQALLLDSPIVTAIIDSQGKFTTVNNSLCHYLGYTKEELLTKTFQEVTLPEDLPKQMVLMNKVIKGELPFFQIDKRHIHKDGHLIWTLVTVISINGDKTQEFITQYQDISERKKSEVLMMKLNNSLQTTLNEIKIREQKEALINKMNDSLQICDNCTEAYPRISLFAKQLFPDLNGALAILKNKNDMKVIEQWGQENLIKPLFSAHDCFGNRSGNVNVVSETNNDISCNHYLTIPQGAQMCLPLIVQDKNIGCIYLYSNKDKTISKLQQELALTFANSVKLTLANLSLRELLRESSIHDPLTGLYNRRYLDETLPRELQRAQRNNTKLFVILSDLDFFKKFNDNYGHDAGDEVLKMIGALFKRRLRGSDVICRFGGEEFLLYIIDNNMENVLTRLEGIRKEIKNTEIIYKDQKLPQITISVGVAFAPDHGTIAKELIIAADKALYKAKELGRDRIEIYLPITELP